MKTSLSAREIGTTSCYNQIVCKNNETQRNYQHLYLKMVRNADTCQPMNLEWMNGNDVLLHLLSSVDKTTRINCYNFPNSIYITTSLFSCWSSTRLNHDLCYCSFTPIINLKCTYGSNTTVNSRDDSNGRKKYRNIKLTLNKESQGIYFIL